MGVLAWLTAMKSLWSSRCRPNMPQSLHQYVLQVKGWPFQYWLCPSDHTDPSLARVHPPAPPRMNKFLLALHGREVPRVAPQDRVAQPVSHRSECGAKRQEEVGPLAALGSPWQSFVWRELSATLQAEGASHLSLPSSRSCRLCMASLSVKAPGRFGGRRGR
ncbi:unnamed protein product [Durusdinium trenchii]|uniref:Uncharacterized protein n=1 Tax=Durusdinium trenchii TaxID=1381693 RepID=A0ABP0QUJ6_9DINO